MFIKHPVSDEKTENKQTQSKLKKICRPKKWREEIDNVKQACWCGEEWYDNHEDGNHSPIWVKVKSDV